MRLAIVSDIHGNLTAFEAALRDVRSASPDIVFHGGDLAHGGANPAGVVDQIRDLGWHGVLGNTDEILFNPGSLRSFARSSPAMQPLLVVIEEMAAAEREALGEERLEWLRQLPRVQNCGPMALVHASPESTWRAPLPEASDAELRSVYEPLGQPIAVYAHTHRGYTRNLSRMMVANTGSASLSYDGDRRASWLLVDDSVPIIRRVEYDVEEEIRHLFASAVRHADWIGRMLRSGRFEAP
jgi:predicted phosphodiesterase